MAAKKQTPKLPVKKLEVPQGAEHIRLSSVTFQDGKAPVPVVEFGQADDRWAFSFGAGKARRILAAVDEVGADVVIHTLRVLAG